MWRIGVLLSFSGILLAHTYPTNTNDEIIQRLKRSPYYDCAPFPYHRPRFYPYPPPPPPGPPPGPPPFYQQQRSQELSQAESLAQASSGSQSQASSGSQSQASSGSQSQASGGSQSQDINGMESHGFHGSDNHEGCDTCGGKKNSAISNAQSETGDAVAVAISKNH